MGNRNHRLKIIPAIIIIAAALLLYRLYYETSTVVFHDHNLESLISEILDKPADNIIVRDMKQLLVLDASGRNIRRLDGLQYATELVILDLEDNFVEDVSPLARMGRLESLSLRNNEIIDLEAVNFQKLHSLQSLSELSLRHNVKRPDPHLPSYQYRLQDISILAEFGGLTTLELRDNHIEDLSPLAGLMELSYLDISHNPLENGDISALSTLLNLHHLNLRECGVHDLSPLGELQLLRYLNLHSNEHIMSVRPIESLTLLETLILRHVPMGDDVDVLYGMNHLQRLNLRDTGLRDTAGLAKMMERGILQDRPQEGVTVELDLRDNPIPVEAQSSQQKTFGYGPLRPYWSNISVRFPKQLPQPVSHQIVISEMMSSNGSTIADESGEYHDWIELYNPNDEPVSLRGWYLSDNMDEPHRWRIPDEVILDRRETLLIWASGLDRRDPAKSLHTNFSISREGEPLLLTEADGETLSDYLPPVRLDRDLSYGKMTDEHDKMVYFDVATPGQLNFHEGMTRRAGVPRFSHPGGFYQEAFQLEASAGDRDTVIYYTTDGSDPAEKGRPLETPLLVLETPVHPSALWQKTTSFGHWREHESWPGFDDAGFPSGPVFQATVIRARGLKDGRWSAENVSTYFVDPLGKQRYTLPVFSFVTDPGHLFDDNDGIYVPGVFYDTAENRPEDTGNYFQRGHEWERPVHITYFEPGGRLVFSQNMGIRIHGGWTRRFPQKSLRLYPRADYDVRNTIEYQLFPKLSGTGTGSQITSFNRVLLRNSGNDWLSTLIRDSVMQQMVPRDTLMSTQAYEPVILFLNGEYWGVHNLREYMNDDYLVAHYDLDPSQIVILENDRIIDYGIPEDVLDYERMLRLIHPDFDNAGYPTVMTLQDDSVLEELAQLMDIDQFIDYYISQIFFDNTDWPGNNVKVWRKRTEVIQEDAPPGHDGRWRWLLFDTDFGFGLHTPSDAGFNTLENALKEDGTEWHNLPWSTFLMRSLLQNQGIKKQFINRFEELLDTNFHADQTIPLIDEAAFRIEPEMMEHIARWGYPGGSYDQWQRNIASMKVFAEERPAFVRQHLSGYFGLD